MTKPALTTTENAGETAAAAVGEISAKPAFAVPEALKLMGDMSIATFYREVNAGRLKVKKCGRKTIVPADAIAAWLASLPEYRPSKTANAG